MIRRPLVLLPVIFIGWIAILAILLHLGGEATAVMVPLPHST